LLSLVEEQEIDIANVNKILETTYVMRDYIDKKIWNLFTNSITASALEFCKKISTLKLKYIKKIDINNLVHFVEVILFSILS
jgi:hypothetical protein